MHTGQGEEKRDGEEGERWEKKKGARSGQVEKDGNAFENFQSKPKRNKKTHVTVSACSSLSVSRYSLAARATATAANAIVVGERADMEKKKRG